MLHCQVLSIKVDLFERLGEGSFAIVRRGVWKRSDDRKIDVAVKILRESSTEVIRDLELEIHNMQKLQHPNLVRLYGIIFAIPAMMV